MVKRRRRQRSAGCFLLAVLSANICGCIWYLRFPEEEVDSISGNGRQNEVDNSHSHLALFEQPKNEKQPDYTGIGDMVTFNYIVSLPEHSIFFIENSERESVFPLALCSLESAALHNPAKSVFLLRSYPGPTRWTRELSILDANYANIHLKRINADHLVLETPVTSLWNGQKIAKSRYSVSHTSDVLRVAILYKFGGTYMDTDIITLKAHPTEEECPNFVNFEEPGSINGAMMRFQAKHPALQVIGDRLAQNFNPRKWASNGPRLLSAALASFCNLSPLDFEETLSLGPGMRLVIQADSRQFPNGFTASQPYIYMASKTCSFFKIIITFSPFLRGLSDNRCGDIMSYGPLGVFAIHYNNWKWFFLPEHKGKVMDAIESSFATHVWGHFFKQEIQWDLMRPDQAFHAIARKHCPKLFSTILT